MVLGLDVKNDRDLYIWKHITHLFILRRPLEPSGKLENTRIVSAWFPIVQWSPANIISTLLRLAFSSSDNMFRHNILAIDAPHQRQWKLED